MAIDPRIFSMTVLKLRALGLSPQPKYPQELYGWVGPRATAHGVLVSDEEWCQLVNALPSPPSKKWQQPDDLKAPDGYFCIAFNTNFRVWWGIAEDGKGEIVVLGFPGVEEEKDHDCEVMKCDRFNYCTLEIYK